NLPTPYIPGLTGGKWEDWHREWVIATTETNERLALPTEGPASDRQSGRAKPSLPHGVRPGAEQDQVACGGRPHLATRARGFPKAPDRPPEAAGASCLELHR